MKTLSLGVVIPTYNGARVIAEALESALRQEGPPDQVIVVDDGSTDETAQVVRQFGDRVEYVLQPNRGPSAARNRGWGRLRTEAVAFLDADDLFLPGSLATRRALLAQGDTVWASTDGFLQDGTGRRWPFSETYPPGARRAEGWILPDLLCRNFICTSGVIVWRDALSAAGGFDESMRWMEDWDLWLRLAARYPTHRSPEPTFVQRLAPDTLSSNREAMIRMRYRALVKMWRLFPREVAAAGAAARRSVADAHNWFGYHLASEGRWNEARPFLRTSIRLCPPQRRAWWLLLRCLAAAGRPARSTEQSSHPPDPCVPSSSTEAGDK